MKGNTSHNLAPGPSNSKEKTPIPDENDLQLEVGIMSTWKMLGEMVKFEDMQEMKD